MARTTRRGLLGGRVDCGRSGSAPMPTGSAMSRARTTGIPSARRGRGRCVSYVRPARWPSRGARSGGRRALCPALRLAAGRRRRPRAAGVSQQPCDFRRVLDERSAIARAPLTDVAAGNERARRFPRATMNGRSRRDRRASCRRARAVAGHRLIERRSIQPQRIMTLAPPPAGLSRHASRARSPTPAAPP
jgi:hypothetical protein